MNSIRNRKIVFRLFITFALMVVGGWLWHFNWLQRPIHYRTYTFSPEEARRLRLFPRAQFAHGNRAWFQNDPETAFEFFRQAVLQDVFFLDAWHRLAEAAAAIGLREKSRDILQFATGLSENVFRWKWPQILLSRELGMQELLYRNTNYLLAHRMWQQDVLQLLTTHLDGDVKAAMAALEPDNLVLYLSWLMGWGKTAEALVVWQKITEIGDPDANTGLQFAHFLLGKKRIAEAKTIWRDYLGIDGMTNAGFEEEITGRGFDWRYRNDRGANWVIARVKQGAYEGRYALQIIFAGRQNISFQNVFQIIPVVPLEKFSLTYSLKSDRITTDQGPFVEIIGYDQKGLSQKGPMITGTHDWREESIEFRSPERCQAVVVRVRRRPSHRFDSKIKGTLWLDNFRLETLSPEKNKIGLSRVSTEK